MGETPPPEATLGLNSKETKPNPPDSPEPSGRGVNFRDRALIKILGARARLNRVDVTGVSLHEQIDNKVKKLVGLINGHPLMATNPQLEGLLGEVELDSNNNLHTNATNPRSQTRLLSEYAATEAAVSTLYSSSPEVQPLPPEGFRVEAFNQFIKKIDEHGILIHFAGLDNSSSGIIKTRFYSIPGQQFDDKRKPIPLNQQKILIVQDRQLSDGRTKRYFTVSNAETLEEYVDIPGQETPAQLKQPAQNPPFLENPEDRRLVIGDEIISPSARRVGETDDQAATQRGWLSAINSANARSIPANQKQQNLQDIARAAVQAGVPRETIAAHLQALGHTAVKSESATPSDTSNPTETASPKPEVALSEIEITKSLDYVARLADSALSGRSNPSALQNFVEYAIRKGVPKDAVEKLLAEKGIKVERKDQPSDDSVAKLKEIESKLSPVLSKLRTVFPDQPAGDGRLGIEVSLTTEDITLIKEAVGLADKILSSKPGLQQLDQIISQYRGKDTAFDIGYGFGTVVREDNAVNQPQYENTSKGPIIRVPAETFRLWKARDGLISTRVIFDFGSYRGSSAAMLLRPLEHGIQVAHS